MKKLWYQKPAEYWEEALPVGNGRLGAMVYGKPDCEIIQLNEDSVWSGGKRDRINPDCLPNLEKIRTLIRKGKIKKAEQLSVLAMSGTPQYQRSYQTLGQLFITHHYPKGESVFSEIREYERSLNLEEAIVVSSWKYDDTCYRQEVFASYPDELLVIHLTCQGKNKLDFACRLDRGRNFDHSFAVDKCTIGFDGGADGLKFCGILRAKDCDGKVQTIGEHLLVADASEVTLCFSAATEYRFKNPGQQAISYVETEKKFLELKEAHLLDYKKLYDRVALEFFSEETGVKSGEPKSVSDNRPTDERIKTLLTSGEKDLELYALYFQYGRYLMIQGSRKGTLPLTLQGIWNEDMTPPWDAKYTININLEMNYWPVDICNLSECAEPYFSLLQKVMEQGKEAAQKMYGCHGFVAHHNTDIHGDCAPQDLYIPATYWVMGGAWMATHIWQHYLFTGNRKFLEDNYEVLRQAVLFFKDFLIEDAEGYLVTSPSVSPENTYLLPNGESGCLCEGTAMDREILHQLLGDFILASKVLGIEEELIYEAQNMKKRLRPLGAGSYGQLLEWEKEYQEMEPGHRHISHLYGVFPGNQITAWDTKELADAARISLEHRLANGGGHTGWSKAWIVILWDRFKDAEMAYENLRELLGASTYTNLMDFHPLGGYKRDSVFQIDGNMGGITGIAEMLVQSHNGRIEFLPCLPKAFSRGYVKGLKVRGNAQISIDWKQGELTSVKIITREPLQTLLCYKNRKIEVTLAGNTSYELDKNLTIIDSSSF